MGSSAEYARVWYQRNRDAIRQQRKFRRRANVALAILEDTRRDDRKHQRTNDLDIEFISTAILKPCTYCGDDSLRRTLDRIDNALGHTRGNVVVACERCNYVRRNMPYGAWLRLAPAMRDARMRGLFGDWTGAIHKRLPIELVRIGGVRRPTIHGTLAGYKKCGPPTCQPCRDAMAAWKRARRQLEKR